MAKLLIVESPAKAKTITKYLGGDYLVKASMGHLRDLPKKELGVDVDRDFEANYIPIEGKGKIIKELKDEAQQADFVYLATDPDREGEAISWHLQQLLELEEEKCGRITFNEITKKAVTEAVEHCRDIDMQLVDAQQARRILDRIVGYKLSPFLWRKVRSGLSAGRVQSVVTRLVVDREREINNFKPQEYWTIAVTLNDCDKEFVANFYGNEAGKMELPDQQTTDGVIAAVKDGVYTVRTVKNAQKKRRPAPPFITSTLQQEASRKLGMTAKRTMSVAQELYEGVEIAGAGLTGLITYMRTDSLRVADEAVAAARSYIEEQFGSKYKPAKARVFKTKKGAQDAHEAIRPANPALTPEQVKKSLTPDQFKLYKLIWSRFMASQMSDAVFDTTAADIENSGYIFRATGQTVKFPGFMALYEESVDEADDEDGGPLPPLKEGDERQVKATAIKEDVTKPPAPHTDASLLAAMETAGKELDDEELVRQMKGSGIGTPATRAAIIERLLHVGYAQRRGKTLQATDKGVMLIDVVPDKLSSPELTGRWELALHDITDGKQDPERFMEGIARMSRFLVDYARESTAAVAFPQEQRQRGKGSTRNSAKPLPGAVCPLCGKGGLRESPRAFSCTENGCNCTIWKDCLVNGGGPELTDKLVLLLLEKKELHGSTGLLMIREGRILFYPKGSEVPSVNRPITWERKTSGGTTARRRTNMR